MSSLKAIRDEAVAIATAVDAAQAIVVDAIRLGTSSIQTYRHVAADMRAQEQALRELRKTMDGTKVTDELIIQRADYVISVWDWERGLRKSLVNLAHRLRTIITVAEDLERGQDQIVYVSRTGDTLQRIAASQLGSWEEWPRLVEANPGVEPGTLPSGTVLIVPRKV